MKVLQRILLIALVCALANAQNYPEYDDRPAPAHRPSSAREAAPAPPVAILKQINKHNEDGSYTYGYEGADGSFKIETKLATGEVKGKYGYVDANGKVRVVEYGANKYGFQPSGEGITVAPPTLVDETEEEPDYDNVPPAREYRPQPRQQSRPAPAPQRQPEPNFADYQYDSEAPAYTAPAVRQQYKPQPQPQPQPQPHYRAPLPKPQHQQAPVPQRFTQIPGAQRTTDVVYSQLQNAPRPEPDYSQSQSFGDGPSNVRISRPVYAPAPETPAPSSARAQGFLAPASGGRPLFSQFGPPQAQPLTRPVQQAIQEPHQHQQQQQQQAQPRYQPQPQSQGRSGGGGSLLDQLARDYALPEGNSQPLHDISFGYY